MTETLIFAGDTSIFYSHSDLKKIKSLVNAELENFDIWMKCNKLSVNVKKTNYVIFKSSREKLLTTFLFTLETKL